MTDIEKMTASEWLAHRQNKLDAFYEAGNELKPNPDCRTRCKLNAGNAGTSGKR